ncbi:MAG: FAD:protein FMN transferase [Planctomycetota bacterium]|nr:FAD:protein FMN transferase [Planctomycetota bacterium]
MRLRLNCMVAAGLALGSVVQARQAPVPTVERLAGCMGTSLRLVVEGPSRKDALLASEAALRAVEAVEARLSTWGTTSELARLNATPVGTPFELSGELAADLAGCVAWQRASAGAFDPSVGALVAAWDLRGAGRVPDESELVRARQATGLERTFRIEGRRATRLVEGARIEEGGFGKGCGLDAGLAALAQAGARGSLDLGGQVATLGRTLELELADPRDRNRPVLAWRLESGSVATSGNSERGRVVDGVRVGHLLDPRTGRPAPDHGSVAVWSASAASADAFSTAAFVLGPDAALKWAAESGGETGRVELVVLGVEGDVLVARATAGLAGRLRVLAPDVRLQLEGQAVQRTGPQREQRPTKP